MSSSNVFKDQGQFKPEKLVPRSSERNQGWQPAAAAVYEQVSAPKNKAAERDDKPTPPLSQPQPAPEPDAAPETDESAEPQAESPQTQQQNSRPAEPPSDLTAIRAESFEAGVQEGLKRAEADFGASMSALVMLCEQLSTIRETILKNSKAEMIELIFALAEKIIRHSVTQQDHTITSTVEEAIQQAVKSSEFTILLNPDDLAVIKARSEEIVAGLNGLEKVVIKAAPDIERGGCKIESDNCTVDATISGQLQVLAGGVREEI